jgi:hypothetical protein
MPETDAFDPTHALDGWRPPAPAPVQELDLDALLHPGPKQAQPLLAHAGTSGFDPTHLLDGWRPPAPAPLDLELKSLQRAGPGPDEATLARLKARGYEMLDVEDIELVETPSMPRVAIEASALEVPAMPPLAEADLAPPASGEDAAQAGGAVDVPLPDEEVWPLFMEEAQVLDAGPAPAAEAPVAEMPAEPAAAEAELNVDEVVPAPGPEVELVPGDDLQPAPFVLNQALEAPAAEEGPEVGPEVQPLSSVELAVVEAATMEVQAAEPGCAEDERVEAVGVASAFEAPAAAMMAEMPVREPELEPVVEPAPCHEEAASLADGAATEAPGPETEEPTPLVVDVQRAQEADDFAAEPEVAEPPIELPVLDFHRSPPSADPPPSFIDEIRLPAVPPPPAVFDAPVLDFRVAPPPPEADPRLVIAGIELPRVSPPPDLVEMPQLDIAALKPQPPEADPRLLARWQAGAWTALTRQVAGASEELLQTPDGLRVESHAPQWLCAIWPPQAEDAPLGRWPELASLVDAETRGDALQQLLGELSDEAPLWSADLDADWDLVAELVLHQDTGLRPAQARALRELADAERSARLLRFNDGYALHGRVARRCA